MSFEGENSLAESFGRPQLWQPFSERCIIKGLNWELAIELRRYLNGIDGNGAYNPYKVKVLETNYSRDAHVDLEIILMGSADLEGLKGEIQAFCSNPIIFPLINNHSDYFPEQSLEI